MMRFLFISAILAMGVSAWAGTPNYVYNRTLDLGPHPDAARMNAGCADANGGVYFTDSSFDAIWYCGNVITADGGSAVDVKLVCGGGGEGGPDFTSGNSYEGICFDGTAIFAGGKMGPDESQYVRITPDNLAAPTAWTVETFNLFVELTGPTAVGPNLIAAAHATDGTVHFLQYSGGVLSDIGTSAAGGTGTAIVSQYDSTTSKMYVSKNDGLPPAIQSRVNIFTSNGTAAGTTFNAAVNPYIAGAASSLLGTDFYVSQGSRYQHIALNIEDQVLAVARNTGASDGNGHALYDLTQTGPNAVPYLTLDQSQIPETAASTNPVFGSVFGTKEGTKFLAVCQEPTAGGSGNKIYVYTQPSSVNDWSVY